ncbi:MAG TPA: cytochrome P450 [Candidatus Dormibacteraeota bacterium]
MKSATELSLNRLFEPEVLGDPYPLYDLLRSEDPVHWDPYLRGWVVTRYDDVVHALQRYSATLKHTPEELSAMGMEDMAPILTVMVRQMRFLDPSVHMRVRTLASRAFTPRRVEQLESHIQEIVDGLLDEAQERGGMDVIADLGRPLPSIVMAELLGVPVEDWPLLIRWAADFGSVLGNFQYNPDRVAAVRRSLDEMSAYFGDQVRRQAESPREGLVDAFARADAKGDRLTEEEIVANLILCTAGGLEAPTNLIGNGILTLLRNPDQLAVLRDDPSLGASAVEELLRYESPSQHTIRTAQEDTELGGRTIGAGQSVITMLGAANRDPEHFPEPDRLDLRRQDNRHVAFGWGAHFCFGAPLARLQGRVTFRTLLRRMPRLRMNPDTPLAWRDNLGFRGLSALPVTF